jgi:hypothetical protein
MRSIRTAGLTFEDVRAVEIVAPDQESAALLLEHSSPSFPAELIVDSGWVVRFHPPAATDPDWFLELLPLIERWLKAVPLPCAKALHGGKSYLIRAPSQFEVGAIKMNRWLVH